MGCGSSKSLTPSEPLPEEEKESVEGSAGPHALPTVDEGHQSHPLPELNATRQIEIVEHDFDFDVFLTHDWGMFLSTHFSTPSRLDLLARA